jgi:hypothetical protein
MPQHYHMEFKPVFLQGGVGASFVPFVEFVRALESQEGVLLCGVVRMILLCIYINHYALVHIECKSRLT